MDLKFAARPRLQSTITMNGDRGGAVHASVPPARSSKLVPVSATSLQRRHRILSSSGQTEHLKMGDDSLV